MRWNASQAECLIYTFKEGLLSRVAHDLKLKVGSLELEINQNLEIDARFDPASIRVLSAMKNGQADPGTLSEKDKRSVEDSLLKEVLEVAKYPLLRFKSTQVEPAGTGYRVRGNLELHGTSRVLEAQIKREGERLKVRVRIHQPDFGIKPFSAMLGTLKIKPDVEVELSTPALE